MFQHILSSCPRLHVAGFMTIGRPDRQVLPGELNPDFAVGSLIDIDSPTFHSHAFPHQTLLECRRRAVALGLHIDELSLELSMGMSADYEQAVRPMLTD